jgi:PHF5-like protein
MQQRRIELSYRPNIYCSTVTSKMAKHHPDLVMCRKQPGIAIGRLCEKCRFTNTACLPSTSSLLLQRVTLTPTALPYILIRILIPTFYHHINTPHR